MKKRMMAAVPKASGIITNPTPYSVALSYERGMQAPVCVAKGVDQIALKIREIAGQHDIPIVENVPLARALYATVEIDQEIPVEHYHAVAEIIGYVMGLRRGLTGGRRRECWCRRGSPGRGKSREIPGGTCACGSDSGTQGRACVGHDSRASKRDRLPASDNDRRTRPLRVTRN